jgi:Flp pilus assembly protein TadD
LVCMCLLLTLCETTAPAQAPGRRDMGEVQSEPVRRLPDASKRFALIIGVDYYQDESIQKLDGAENDAKALGRALEQYAGFPPQQITILTTDQPRDRSGLIPTKSNIEDKVKRLLARAIDSGKDSLVLIAFAGHGVVRRGRSYFLPSDAFRSNFEGTAVDLASMRDLIVGYGVEQVVLVIDACRSKLDSDRSPAEVTLAEELVKALELRNKGLKAFATFNATDVGLSAYEYADADGKKRGYFTTALVEALQGRAMNSRAEVTLAGIREYLERVVPERVRQERGSVQRPHIDVSGYKSDELVMAIVPRAGALNGVLTTEPSPVALELSFWETIKNSNNPEDFKAYLEKYPNGEFISLAKLRAGHPTSATASGQESSSRRNQAKVPSGGSNGTSTTTLVNPYAGMGAEEIALRQKISRNPNKSEHHRGLAKLLVSLGRDVDAEAEYKTAVRLDPKSFFNRYELAQFYNKRQKYGESEALYREAIRLRPNSAGDHVNLASALESQKRLGEAEAEYRAAVALAPKDAWTYLMLGIFLENTNRLGEAEWNYSKAVELDPKNTQWRTYLARCLDKQGKSREADIQFSIVGRENPRTLADRHYGKAIKLYNQGQSVGAESEIRAALQIAPDEVEYHYILALSLDAQSKDAEAESEYKLVVATGKDGQGYGALGSFYLTRKRYTEAIDVYRRGSSYAPKDPYLHSNLGMALEKLKRYDEAESEYRLAMQLDPKGESGREKLFSLLTSQRRYGEVGELLQSLIQREPKVANNYKTLGSILMEQKKFSEAEAQFRQALQFENTDGWLYRSLGEALARQRKLPEAEAAFRRAIAVSPNEAWFHNDLAFCLSNQRRAAEAIDEQVRAVTMSPNDASLRYNLGVLFYNHGKVSDAEREYRYAIQLRPTEAHYHFGLYSCLSREGRWKEAEVSIKEALRLEPNNDTYRTAWKMFSASRVGR